MSHHQILYFKSNIFWNIFKSCLHTAWGTAVKPFFFKVDHKVSCNPQIGETHSSGAFNDFNQVQTSLSCKCFIHTSTLWCLSSNISGQETSEQRRSFTSRIFVAWYKNNYQFIKNKQSYVASYCSKLDFFLYVVFMLCIILNLEH